MGVQFHPEFLEEDPAWEAPASITNETLVRLASRHVDPQTGASGISNPGQMIASGILRYMSADNDAAWKILAQAAEAHRHKARIKPEVLAGGEAAHEEPPGRPKVPHPPRGAAATPPGGALKPLRDAGP
ncbi:MAG TPA: hypothetical protein VFL86_19060 [Burkholderiaceae bacterium]|nr:hypothetical protein [Burkholderiaceae bacterium]